MKRRSSPAKSATPGIRRLLAAACAAIGAVPSAQAACTYTLPQVCIANEPIQAANVVKPNVMLILDNSGSMDWDIMSVDSGLSENVNRGARCRKNYQYNTVYYNPNINYTAAVPKNASGTSMGSQTFTSAKNDPFLSSSTTNLSTSFCAVSAQCGSTQTNVDLRPQNAYYYKYTGTGSPGDTCAADANYTKVVVGSNSCVVGGDVTACPTGADERENFANWYSYFRTRILMAKSGMATAFSTIDDKIRVGFHTINNPGAGNSTGRSLNIDDFAATQKSNWYSALFSIDPNGGTPLREALSRVGNYYANSGTKTGLSGDPVQYSCQKNFAILTTDGYWNGSDSAVSVGNVDGKVPNAMPIKDGASVYNSADTGLVQGADFPRPYRDSGSYTKTLADVAMYYWVTDLRTSGTVAANNVPTTTADPAYWQHMNTIGVGLGVNGQLAFPGDLAALTSGAKNWPQPKADTKTAVDDLWHASINGRGQYYRATDPTSLSASLNAALRAVTDVLTYGVGPASSTSDFKSPDQSDYTTYEASYRVMNWSGDVKKFNVDRTTGLKTGNALWSAAKKLDEKVNPGLTATVNATAYTTRNIVTRRDDTGAAVAFTFATLSPAQQTHLCYKASPGTGPCVANDASLVNYLRGDATYEGDYGVTGKRFRNRHDGTETGYYKRDLMGTIVNAQPAYVAAEKRIYQDITDPGYSTFKTSTNTRAPVLYAPANDGMVHALDASTGDELWAYVPSLIIPTGTDENGREKGLRALSYQDGGAPAYNHHFYVDASPEVGAVDFQRAGIQITDSSPSGSWRNILVGGLGKGGKGYYALDVTTPATTLTAARTAVLWEFPSPADPSHAPVISGGLMGHSHGKPIIAKTKRYGWSVIVPSGYNNADGFGYLFILNAQTGALLDTLKTTSAAPGLAKISALAKSNNKIVKEVYGGDLNGSLWRFDLEDPEASPPKPKQVSQIFSSSSNTPITAEPSVAVDPNSGERWVFFGTGKYLDVPDRTATGTQYLVALKDGTVTAPGTAGVVPLSSLTSVSDLMSGASGVTLGWKYQLPNSGERVVNKPVADLRTVVFSTLAPSSDPCSPGTAGYAYGLEYNTAKSRLTVNGTVQPSIYSATGISAIDIQTTGKSSGSSGAPQIVIRATDGQSARVGMDTRKINSGTRHVGWRELLNEY